MDKSLFTLRGIHFSHDNRSLFSDFNLDLKPNRCYGILGPNGSGKTTLLDLLCGLLKPDQGNIHLFDNPLNKYSKKELARYIALVPQDFFIHFNYTVRQVVEMGRHPHLHRFSGLSNHDISTVDTVMRELAIESFATRLVTELSGGEKQRVAVARALAQEPQVLLLDEATSNLDIYHSLSILKVIGNRVSTNVSVVAVIHDLNLAASFCDDILFLKNGKLIAAGPVDDILQPEIISEVFGVETAVRRDDFTGVKQVSFRIPDPTDRTTQ